MSEPSLAHPVAFALAEASMDDEAVTRSDAEAMAEGERERCRGRTCCLRQRSFGLGSACDRQRFHGVGQRPSAARSALDPRTRSTMEQPALSHAAATPPRETTANVETLASM